MRTDERYEGEVHPCLGKDCMQCETCIYDRPLEDVLPKPKEHKTVPPNRNCNYCGYLIKQFKDRGDTIFNACCSKVRIEASTYSRPRTIDFRLKEGDDIETPHWCPKLKEATRLSSEPKHVSSDTNITYTERRNRLKALPPHLDWNQITPGKTYLIPSILGRKRKLLIVKYKTEFTLVCNEILDNGNTADFITNIFKTDIDTNFIVEYKKF